MAGKIENGETELEKAMLRWGPGERGCLVFALSYLYNSFSLSLFLNLSYSPRGQQEKRGSNGVVIQTEDLKSQGRGVDRALCLFPEKV